MDLSRISAFIIRKRILSFLLYLAFISIIVIGSSYDDLFLVAPPYAVSLYLITFESKSKFSRKKNIILSYSFVILTTELIHVIMGIGTLPLYTSDSSVILPFVIFDPVFKNRIK